MAEEDHGVVLEPSEHAITERSSIVDAEVCAQKKKIFTSGQEKRVCSTRTTAAPPFTRLKAPVHDPFVFTRDARHGESVGNLLFPVGKYRKDGEACS